MKKKYSKPTLTTWHCATVAVPTLTECLREIHDLATALTELTELLEYQASCKTRLWTRGKGFHDDH